MTVDELKEMLPTKEACRSYLEQAIWRNGRGCPHCGCLDSWGLKGKTTRSGLYECSGCHGHFTVTTKTPMHGTKLPLWPWILAMYYILGSSKGVSSVILSRLIGVSQKTAWKLGHTIRGRFSVRPYGDRSEEAKTAALEFALLMRNSYRNCFQPMFGL